MNTYESLKEDLIQLGIRPTDVVTVHSSMKRIGETVGGGDTVLDVFCDYLGEEGMLILPCHNWGNICALGSVFDVNFPSNLGLLPNLFRVRENVHRSLHPTHSVCAYGKNAEAYVQETQGHIVSHPRTSCYGKLLDYNAKILLVGVTLTSNTFFHYIESQVFGSNPHWLEKEPLMLYVKHPDGTISEVPHFCSTVDTSANFDRALEVVLKEPTTVTGKFGQADCILMDCRKIYQVVSDLMTEYPRIFLDKTW